MIRIGFVSNSSSSSFLIRSDGFDKKFFSVEDLKEKFPLNEEIKQEISEAEQESIYIGLWLILNTESDAVQDVTDDLPDKWKQAKMVEVGQDYYYDYNSPPFPFQISQLMFRYGKKLFSTPNVKVYG